MATGTGWKPVEHVKCLCGFNSRSFRSRIVKWRSRLGPNGALFASGAAGSIPGPGIHGVRGVVDSACRPVKPKVTVRSRSDTLGK